MEPKLHLLIKICPMIGKGPDVIAMEKTRWLTLVLVTLGIGYGSGLSGMALGLLLRFVQCTAFGRGLHAIVG